MKLQEQKFKSSCFISKLIKHPTSIEFLTIPNPLFKSQPSLSSTHPKPILQIVSLQMNSYLQTLKNLQLDHSNSQILLNASKYNNYEDFLHRRSKLKQIPHQLPPPQPNILPHIQIQPQPTVQFKNKSETVYYPVHRTEIQYHDRQYVERIPKKKKVVEYVEQKSTEIVPKEIVKTDYYAVQHLRAYYKQVVPQIKVEMVQVPKTIKNVEYLPKEKQIIFYPSHLTDMKEIKDQAKMFLQKQGVVIKEDAEYRPLSTKVTSLEVNANLAQKLKTKIEQAQHKLQKLQKIQLQEYSKNVERSQYRPSHSRLVPEEYRNSGIYESYKRGWSNIPIYQKQKYQSKINKSLLSKNTASNLLDERIDSSFAQKDLYRYNLAVNSSIKSKY